jgi:hypothetical protein
MSDRSTERQPRLAAPTSHQDEGTPLAEFAWSERVVGMGYFPDEVGLPSDWTWAANSEPEVPAPPLDVPQHQCHAARAGALGHGQFRIGAGANRHITWLR